MPKKIISLIMILTIVMSIGVVSYADSSKTVKKEDTTIISSPDEIRNYEVEIGKGFFIPSKNNVDTRAICPNCYEGQLITGEYTENHDLNAIDCPEGPQLVNDHFLTFRNYDAKMCENCGHVIKIRYLSTHYITRCYAESFDPLYAWTDYDVILNSCPVCDGLNGHQCIDPDDPWEDPYERHANYH
jgi:hypothetical protein